MFSGTPTQPTCVQTSGTVYPGTVAAAAGVRRPARLVGQLQFTTAGTYSFVCSAHPPMTGTVIVESTTRARDDDQQRPGRTDEPDVGELHVLVQPAGGDVRVQAGHAGGHGTYAACTSPAAFTTTANGNYTFNVRARAGRDA